jgi:hypothetical protein
LAGPEVTDSTKNGPHTYLEQLFQAPTQRKQNGALSSYFEPEGEKTSDLDAVGVLERVVVGVGVNIYCINSGR